MLRSAEAGWILIFGHVHGSIYLFLHGRVLFQNVGLVTSSCAVDHDFAATPLPPLHALLLVDGAFQVSPQTLTQSRSGFLLGTFARSE